MNDSIKNAVQRLAHWKNSLKAVDTIMKSLESSSFADSFGKRGLDELHQYRTDMAIDIYTAITDKLPTKEMLELALKQGRDKPPFKSAL